jgi:hypothetical protein
VLSKSRRRLPSATRWQYVTRWQARGFAMRRYLLETIARLSRGSLVPHMLAKRETSQSRLLRGVTSLIACPSASKREAFLGLRRELDVRALWLLDQLETIARLSRGLLVPHMLAKRETPQSPLLRGVTSLIACPSASKMEAFLGLRRKMDE